MSRERAQADLHSNCFLLVPLMPLCQSLNRRNSHLTIEDHRSGHVPRIRFVQDVDRDESGKQAKA
ncbi:unnamed protein product [Nippostrongylus brasiliensis]|uniref:Secreted protein n=1 Tax=Nippostrongylus brasiliensis TaxID=27835 RepID=A0A0N4YDZ0_NIPBR|nr:unnamed protein product [Nippostrongylus brasiliensis]